MSLLEDSVDQVIAAFDARRRAHWHATALPLTGADQELQRWSGLVEARVNAFHHSVVDRDAFLQRVRRRFQDAEWTADFAGVADELQEMAREDLRRHLTDNGVPEPSARRIAAGYSIGALLHEP